MTAPPATKRRAGRPPKIAHRTRWGIYINADHRLAGQDRARQMGHGDYTDVLRSLMAAYASGKLDAHAMTGREAS